MTLQQCDEDRLSVATTAPWAEVISYLQQHVGDLLWSNPIHAWHGLGWHVQSKWQPAAASHKYGYHWYKVTFDNSRDAVAFALKWS